MHNTTLAYLCNTALDFANNPGVLLVDMIHVLLSVSTVFCTFATAAVLLWKRIFHRNVRAILASFLLAMGLYFFGDAACKAVVLLREFYVRHSRTDVDCTHLLMSTAECIPLIALEIVAYMISTNAITLLVFERVWATVQHKTYEHSRSKVFVIVTIASWFIIPLLSLPVHMDMLVKNTPIYHCSALTSFYIEWQGAGGELMYYAYAIACVELVTLVIFGTLLCVNKRLERQNQPSIAQPAQLQSSTKHSLSQRYQLWDNVRVGRFIVRMVIGHAISFTVGTVLALSMLHFFRSLSLVDSYLIRHVYDLSFHIFGLFLVRVCAKNSRQFTQVVRKQLPGWMCKMLVGSKCTSAVQPIAVKPANGFTEHFEMLDKIWHVTPAIKNAASS